MTNISKAPVSERALEARVRRALAKEGQQLKRNNSQQWAEDLGSIYIVDSSTNSVIATHCELAKLADELGVLKAHERLAKAKPA